MSELTDPPFRRSRFGMSEGNSRCVANPRFFFSRQAVLCVPLRPPRLNLFRTLDHHGGRSATSVRKQFLCVPLRPPSFESLPDIRPPQRAQRSAEEKTVRKTRSCTFAAQRFAEVPCCGPCPRCDHLRCRRIERSKTARTRTSWAPPAGCAVRIRVFAFQGPSPTGPEPLR